MLEFIDLILVALGLCWASLVAQLVKNPPAMQETSVRFLDPEVSSRSFRLPTVYSWASLVAQMVKTACSVGDLGSIPGLEGYPGGGHGSLLQDVGFFYLC